MKQFIITSDNKTKQTLIQNGFQIINETSSGFTTFITKPNFCYEDKDLKFTYSNMLTF